MLFPDTCFKIHGRFGSGAEEPCFHGGVCFKSLSDILTESDISKHGMAFILPSLASPLSPAYFPELPPVKLMVFPSTCRLRSSSFTMHISFSPTDKRWRAAYANIKPAEFIASVVFQFTGWRLLPAPPLPAALHSGSTTRRCSSFPFIQFCCERASRITQATTPTWRSLYKRVVESHLSRRKEHYISPE